MGEEGRERCRVLREGERASTHQSWLFIWNGRAPRKFAVLSIYGDPVLHTVDLHSSSYSLQRRVGGVPEGVTHKRERVLSAETRPLRGPGRARAALGRCPEDQSEVNVEEAGFQAQVTWGQA